MQIGDTACPSGTGGKGHADLGARVFAKNSGKQQRTAKVLLFFELANGRRPWISAKNEIVLAVDLSPKQQKQRNGICIAWSRVRPLRLISARVITCGLGPISSNCRASRTRSFKRRWPASSHRHWRRRSATPARWVLWGAGRCRRQPYESRSRRCERRPTGRTISTSSSMLARALVLRIRSGSGQSSHHISKNSG
jgi:hypothetical protein